MNFGFWLMREVTISRFQWLNLNITFHISLGSRKLLSHSRKHFHHWYTYIQIPMFFAGSGMCRVCLPSDWVYLNLNNNVDNRVSVPFCRSSFKSFTISLFFLWVCLRLRNIPQPFSHICRRKRFSAIFTEHFFSGKVVLFKAVVECFKSEMIKVVCAWVVAEAFRLK